MFCFSTASVSWNCFIQYLLRGSEPPHYGDIGGRTLLYISSLHSLSILFKDGYNFLIVHPWHQSDWYYGFVILSLSVMGALLLRGPWLMLKSLPVARTGVVTIYVLLTLLSASEYYSQIVYQAPKSEDLLWERREDLRHELHSHGVSGLINFDDGITAFLLDFPDMHGFAFATDVDAQRAYKAGRMLSLAYARDINTLTGLFYMTTDKAPQSDAQIREYLRGTLAWDIMRSESDKFEFSLAYYDPVLKLPFISFKPIASR